LFALFICRTSRAPRSEKSGTNPNENNQHPARAHHVQHVRLAAKIVLLLEIAGQTSRIAFPERTGSSEDILFKTGGPSARPAIDRKHVHR